MSQDQVMSTNTEPALLGPLTRWYRTIIQVVLAVLAAIPAVVAALDLPAETATKVVGMAGAAVIVVSAIQNAFNSVSAKRDEAVRDIGLSTLEAVVIVILVFVLLIAFGVIHFRG
jgi:hypothetical protein